jgi:hypothetical protein
MAKKNRKMLAWVEYPLLAEHIPQLPSGLIDAIMGVYRDKEWVDNENETGIKQLSYSSMQGSEYLFPNYFPTVYRNKMIDGRLKGASTNVSAIIANGAKPIGTFAAAWDDAGLHNETFWLGWATVTQYGWSIGQPTIEQSTADFMDIYYGYNSPEMVEIYKLLENGARFYESLWDRVISTEREPTYGCSIGKGIGTEVSDLTLDMPPLPLPKNIKIDSSWSLKYEAKILDASKLIKDNDKLISLLLHNISRVSQNRYNLEVLLSIAYMERYSINMLLNLAKAENYLLQAGTTEDDPQKAINQMVEAHKLTKTILVEEKKMWSEFNSVWNKSRYEKCRSVNGKNFVHVFDDVKDHFADRRLGLEYMLAPFERMEIKKWQNELEKVIKEYAKNNNITVKGIEEERLED